MALPGASSTVYSAPDVGSTGEQRAGRGETGATGKSIFVQHRVGADVSQHERAGQAEVRLLADAAQLDRCTKGLVRPRYACWLTPLNSTVGRLL